MATSKEIYYALRPLILDIVQHLNTPQALDVSPWTLEEQNLDDFTGSFKVTRGSTTLWISSETRLTVDGILPRGKDNQYLRAYDKGADGSGGHEVRVAPITVAVSRGAEVIAKEINKRFLPECLTALWNGCYTFHQNPLL